MQIITNPDHHHHHVVGRFVRQTGEARLEFHDAALGQPARHAADDKEMPARFESIAVALSAAGWLGQTPYTDYGIEPILRVHTPDFVTYLRTAHAAMTAATGIDAPLFPEAFPVRQNVTGRTPRRLVGQHGHYAMDVYTPIVAGTWTAAYGSAQTALTGAARLSGGASAVYALCRPSGHHASADVYGGFCFLNNAAIAAADLKARGAGQVAILDVDYHHGNGTQAIFYDDPDVLFVSLHGHPDAAFPYYTGWEDERGAGAGLGYNVNVPLANGTTDAEYLIALETACAHVRAYAPDALIVSAGFDVLAGDPYGGFLLTLDGLRRIAEQIARLRLPTLIVQEGGYQPEQLGQFVITFLSAFEEHHAVAAAR